MPEARRKKKTAEKKTPPKSVRARLGAAAAKRKRARKRPRARAIAEPQAIVRRGPGPNPSMVRAGGAAFGLMQPQPATTRGVTTSPRARFSRACWTILSAALGVDEIQILPTGILYIQWATVNARFNAAFGGGGWRLLPKEGAEGRVEQGRYKDTFVQEFVLEVSYAKIWDKVCYATGRHTYRKNNPIMTAGDAIEAAKSSALKRCGKPFSIGNELTLKPFQKAFRRDHCVAVECKRRKKVGDAWKEIVVVEWRRNDDEPLRGEVGTAPAHLRRVQTRDDETIIDVKPIRAPQPQTPTVGPPSQDPEVAYVFVEERFVRGGVKDDDRWQLWNVTMRRADQPTGGELVELGYFTQTDDEVAGLRRVIAEQTPLTLDWENTDNGTRLNGYQPAAE